MKKVWLGVFAALAMASTACSSSSSSNGPSDSGHPDGGGDTIVPGDGSGTDTHGTDTKHDVTPTDGPSDVACAENTVGIKCTGDSDCDKCGTGDNKCVVNGIPTPVCWGVGTCDPGDGSKIVACDNADGTDRGVCLSDGSGGGLCLPACQWDDTGAPVTGCQGKDHCYPMGWSTSGTITGVGYCFSGCKSDADCATPGATTTKCSTVDGICMSALPTYTKVLGDACTYKTTAGAKQDCNCYAASATDLGYCTQFCDIGDTTCGAGYVCGAALPSACASGSALFTKTPSAGMAGNCLKTCTADADCTAINSKCITTPDGKVCLPFDPGSGC